MNVAAFIIGLLCGIVVLFFAWGGAWAAFALMNDPLTGLLMLLVPALSIIGGCLALSRKRSGAYMLRFCAGWYIIDCLILFFGSSFINNKLILSFFMINALLGGAHLLSILFAVLYSVAAFCAFGGAKEAEKEAEEKAKVVSHTPVLQTPQPVKTFEPILGVETPALIKRGYLFLEEGNFDEAERYFEQALKQDPENSKAYLGKLMVRQRVRNMDKLREATISLGEDKLFQRAMQFANEEEKASLESYLKAQEDKLLEKKYANAINQRKALETTTALWPYQIRNLAMSFEALGDYKDSKSIAEELRRQEEKLNEEIRRQEAERQEQRKIREEQEKLRAERNKKRMKLIAVIVIAGAAIYYGVGYYQEYTAAKRAEEARIGAEKQEEKSRVDALRHELQQKGLLKDEKAK